MACECVASVCVSVCVCTASFWAQMFSCPLSPFGMLRVLYRWSLSRLDSASYVPGPQPEPGTRTETLTGTGPGPGPGSWPDCTENDETMQSLSLGLNLKCCG